MKSMKQALALLLCFLMLFSTPVNAFAKGGVPVTLDSKINPTADFGTVAENCDQCTPVDGDHAINCPSRCNCGTTDNTHADTCPLYKCPSCVAYSNQVDHEDWCDTRCSCGDSKPENSHLESCELYRCPECETYINQGYVHYSFCSDFLCPYCIEPINQIGATDGCICYYADLFNSTDSDMDTWEVYIGFLDKSKENIVLFDDAVSNYGNGIITLPTSNCPDYLIIGAQYYTTDGLIKFYDLESFDATFNDNPLSYYYHVEPKYFTTVVPAAGLYATISGSGTVKLLKDPYVNDDSVQVDISVLANKYTVADFKYEVGTPEEWFFKLTPNEDWPSEAAEYLWIPAKYVTLSQMPSASEPEDTTPIFTTCTTTVNGTSIAVEGKMISGTALSVSAYSVTNPGAFGITDTSGIKAAYDIKLLDANGNEVQPDSSVFVIMDAAAMGLSNGDVVEVIHQHGSTVETTTHVVINGKLIFPVSGFSVFIVNSTTDTTGTEITGNSEDNPYVMTVGDEVIFFDSFGGGASAYTAVTNTNVRQMYNNNTAYYNNTTYYYFGDGEYKEVVISRTGNNNNRRYTISYADGGDVIETNLQGDNQPSETYYYKATGSTSYRGEWQVTDESNAISYEITSVDYQNYKHMAPYITVTAKDVGLVTLTYKYVNGNNIYEETLYISVVAPANELYVDDQVAEIGCLVPAGLENVAGVTYTWTRSDGQVIRSEALNANGTVNVSLDRGGLTEGRDPITYTATATLTDGTKQAASYEVLYSNEILNPSFENTPVEGGLTNQYFYNGYPGLYWKTTTPGSSTSQLTQDIEIITVNGDPAGSYGSNVTQASHGKQFAEVNAEGFGALYQDILTTPGATLNWSFAHMARTKPSDSENTMYVVVAATEYAQSIIDFDDIDDLLGAARNSSIPSSGTGARFQYNGGTYYIWKHDGTNNWETISGSYVVPNDQYLTRLFFVSETKNANSVNETCGNLIDAVSAGETMSYKIEYYVDGSLVSGNTQMGSTTVYTSVDLLHLDNYIANGYVLTSAKIQLETGNVDYPGNVTNGLSITSYGDSGYDDYAIILKVYLAKRAVTITKNIIIEGWTEMTDEEKTALIGSGLTAKFALTSNSKTYTAALTIIAVSSTGELTAMGEFVDGNGDAPVNGTYIVTETDAPIINGYSCSRTFDKESITVSNTNPTAAIVCTNEYKHHFADLTITKSGWNPTDENQSYIFTVTGPNDFEMDVVINGNGRVTIKDLPLGEYTVTENTDWSWRYTPDKESKTILLVANGENEVTFANNRRWVYWLSGDSYNENQFTVKPKEDDDN